MELYNINNLPIDQSLGLYDFTVSTFQYKINFNLFAYIVRRDEEMRIDLVCKHIFNSTTEIDFLLDFNGIINPLNIHEGDIIFHVRLEDVQYFRIKPTIFNELRTQLANTNKKARIDKNRQKRLEEEALSLPPTINQKDTDPVTIQGDNIILGGGLF